MPTLRGKKNYHKKTEHISDETHETTTHPTREDRTLKRNQL